MLKQQRRMGKEQAQHPDKPALGPAQRSYSATEQIPHRNSTNIQEFIFLIQEEVRREVIVAVGPESQPLRDLAASLVPLEVSHHGKCPASFSRTGCMKRELLRMRKHREREVWRRRKGPSQHPAPNCTHVSEATLGPLTDPATVPRSQNHRQ